MDRKRYTELVVRLACSECDRDDYDFISEEALEALVGWEDIVEIQSYENSIKTYEYNDPCMPENYSVLDWYTHIGLCPDCSEELQRELEQEQAERRLPNC